MSLRKRILIKFKKLTRVMSFVKPTKEDIKDYISFFFQVPRDKHPHDQFEHRLNNKRNDLDVLQGGRPPRDPPVWHLLHGNLTNFYRTLIPVTQPVKHFQIMFSPYISTAVFRQGNPANSEFPEVSEGDLPDLLKQDTDNVYLLGARINGRGVKMVRIADSADDVVIGKDNVFGIPDDNGPGRPGPAKVYYDGYFVKLEPLGPGDYLIESKGYSPNFENDVRYSVYNRAGVFP